MVRGGKSLWLVGCFAAGACAATDGELKIRERDPAAALHNGGDSLDVARGQLALGNVGLALEGFRKAARERPDSPEPLRGIAACYDAMGRFDLARSNYEAALALAPRDPSLLRGLAGSLERKGDRVRAAAVRAEAARAVPAKTPTTTPTMTAAATAPKPAIAPTVPRQFAMQLPPPAPARSTVEPVATKEPIRMEAKAQPLPAPKREAEKPASTVTMILPPPRPFRPKNAEAKIPSETKMTARKPKLERLSLGEVALLTGNTPAWRTIVVAQNRQSTTVRFVPLATAAARPGIRLLNAARREGLAAHTRNYLLDLGWRRIAVGDAPQTRDRSLVLYPVRHAGLGRRVAAQFGFRSAASKDAGEILVLLGRDAAQTTRSRTQG